MSQTLAAGPATTSAGFPVSVNNNIHANVNLSNPVHVNFPTPIGVSGHIGIYPSGWAEIVVIIVLAIVFALIGGALGVLFTKYKVKGMLATAATDIELARRSLEEVPGRASLKAAVSELDHIAGLGSATKIFGRFLSFPRAALDAALAHLSLLPAASSEAVLDASRQIDLYNAGAAVLNARQDAGTEVDAASGASLEEVGASAIAHARYAGSLIKGALSPAATASAPATASTSGSASAASDGGAAEPTDPAAP